MEERKNIFYSNYIPILYQKGPLSVFPESTYNIGNHFSSITTHNVILLGPKELPQVLPNHLLLEKLERENIAEDMLYGEEAASAGLMRRAWCHYQKGFGGRWPKFLTIDYVVPGYTGCLSRKTSGVVDLIRPDVLSATPERNISQHIDTVQKYGGEPLREILPIFPKIKAAKACRRLF